jgi:hypothetical protein
MWSLRHCDGLSDFSTAVRTLINKIDPGHVPVRLDFPDIHRQESDATRANHRCDLGFVLLAMLNVGWHFGSPFTRKHVNLNPAPPIYQRFVQAIMNSLERIKNVSLLFVSVAFL